MKKAIAMRCTQKNWDSIKDKLINLNYRIYSVSSFDEYNYITNTDGKKESISNIKKEGFFYVWERIEEIHETFNAKIFLEACGYKTKPTLEEVKQYFKDAEMVESIYGRKGVPTGNFHFEDHCYFCEYERGHLALWKDDYGYAKILTYKEKKFEITREQIWEIYNYCNNQELKNTIKTEYFPEVFKKELVVGKWYKCDGYLMAWNNGNKTYGFWNNEFSSDWAFGNDKAKFLEESTPQEVETALTREAKKRGFVNGVFLKKSGINKQLFVKNPINGNFNYFESVNILDSQNGCGHIFDNGKWATIIETITIQEAEKLLKEQGINKKIVGL